MNIKLKYKVLNKTAYLFIMVFVFEICFPSVALALTSGPTPPEFKSFEPATTTDMVDLFSGDYTYNLPLFELPGPSGGYPFNLAYHAGPGMEQDASWVGLGWDLNAGAINRNMRGLPDEFNGDEGDVIKKTEHTKPNVTVGANIGASLETFGFDLGPLGIGGNVSCFYNSYKGIGYSVGFGISLKGGKGDVSGGLGLNISMNTHEGVDMAPSLSLSASKEATGANNVMGKGSLSASLGANFNSMEGYKGMSFGLSSSFESDQKTTIKHTRPNGKSRSTEVAAISPSVGGGFNFGMYSSPSVVPTINSATKGSGLDIQFKFGATGGLFPNGSVGGFYSEEHLVNNSKTNPSIYKAYGYNYLYNAENDPNAMLDFNREKDGAISKYTKALPIPNYTFDVWSVVGQGIGQSVRAHQSNNRFVFDKHTENKMGNGNFYYEFGTSGATTHGGGGGGLFVSISRSGYWDGEGSSDDHIIDNCKEDANFSSIPTYEPYYYKVNGDNSSYKPESSPALEGSIEERMGGYDAMAMTLKPYINGDESDFYPSGIYKSEKSNNITIDASSERVPRSNLFLEIQNKQLIDNNSALQELKSSVTTSLNSNNYTYIQRDQYKKHHIGGFIATNSDGLRYVYGIPVYNKKQIECAFSVMVDRAPTQPQNRKELEANKYNPKANLKYTNNYYSKTEIPEYPNTYLLTGVVGPDYIDINNDGITSDDLGYWVKFNYYKASGYFNWRMPFKGANFNMGMASSGSDDKGSYMYGEREQYYLQSAETKTHIAIFTLDNRDDNQSANNEEKNDDGTSVAKKLSKIELYTRNEYSTNGGIPIKTINLKYNSDFNEDGLCNGPNLNSSTGKLTLKEISFKYKNSTRSEKNVYKFDYANNQGYNTSKQDCWGTYDQDRIFNVMNPYVNQTKPKSYHDDNAGVWSLNKITMPSGAIININYESDDYSYVQNKKVMQMTQMCNSDGLSDGTFSLEDNMSPYVSPSDLSKRWIYVKLHNNNEITDAEFRKQYLGNDKYLYYKIKVDLLSKNRNVDKEYIGAYAEVDDQKSIDFFTTSNGKIAKIYLKAIKTKDGTYDGAVGHKPNYHPMSIAAWNFLQMNRPDLIGSVENAFPETSNPTKQERRKILMSLLNPFKGLAFAIRGFYGGCSGRHYGSNVDLSESYVRLYSNNERPLPNGDKLSYFKYGGGLRVKQITIAENETASNNDKLGVVYDYTTVLKDAQGNVVKDPQTNKPIYISSGVATYEPSVGGEENPLRQPLPYEVDIKAKTNYTLFTELPYNESLFPAPSVGYSRVSVRSLITDRILNDANLKGIPSTGQTVHSFYTCKDYPVISTCTDLSKSKFANDKPISIFTYFFNSTKNFYFGSQGYAIELNDMNGKPKSQESYAINTNGKILDKPIAGTYYYYKDKPLSGINDGEPAYQLDNKVSIIEADMVPKSDYTLGVDFDIINDLRQSVTRSGGGQVDINVDLLLIYPLPTAFPRISISEDKVKTAVTNKIIYRSAILDKTVQLVDGGGQIETKNLYFDKLTGQPLVQQIKNEFGKTIESRSYPAYWEYEAMGPAYKNIGARFNANVVPPSTTPTIGQSSNYILATIPANGNNTDEYNYVRPGDELLITKGNNKYKGIIMKTFGDQIWIDVRQGNTVVSNLQGKLECFIYRSGWRNQLNAKIQNYSTLN